MEGLQECPVCTLYMREGISLKKHLDTHPKDQVIEALLRIKNEPGRGSNSSQMQGFIPPLQPAPQLTTAFTYQQILTTNSAGAIVPQYMQIPMFVNSASFPSAFPGMFNPGMGSYAGHPYIESSNVSTNIPSSQPLPSSEEHDNVCEAEIVDGSCEMELSDSSPTPPPLASVIISRPGSSYSSSPSHRETPSPPPLIPSPSVASSSPSCKIEDTVIVEAPFPEEEFAEEQQVENYKAEQGMEQQEQVHETYENEGVVEYYEEAYEEEVQGEQENGSSVNLKEAEELYGDLNVNLEQQLSPVYADLMPARSASHRVLQDFKSDFGAGTSTTFMELDGIRIFFNGSILSSAPRETSPSPSKSCSVIQLADSTKPDPYEQKEFVDVKETSLNILADESMPARGELSEQESLGADSAWGLFQQDVKHWGKRAFKCSSCEMSFACPKERRVHRNTVHCKPAKAIHCTACPTVFSTLRDRRIHMSVHNVKTEPVEEPSSTCRPCPECPTILPNVRSLRIHLREEHNHVRFKCETQGCQANFDEEADFNEHLKIHPLKCPQCDKRFLRRANLNLHKKRHLDVKPFVCSLCPKSFVTRQKLEEHTNGHSGIKPIKCNLCSKTFSRHSNLIQHKNLHHLRNKKKSRDFVCRCGEIFHSQKKLDWHKEIHEGKPKSCPFCPQKFIHAASVTRHVRKAHLPDYLPREQGEEENVSCPMCDKTYLRSSLQVHMRVHSGERPFQCTICTKKFSTKWNMELHQWTHQSRAQMPYKCTMCKSAFFRESDYVAHVNAHKNLKPFICNYCGQKFIRKYNCLRHQEEHVKAKRFSCTVRGCDRSFHRSYYLKDHMKVHTGVRPHTCHICGKASTTKSNHNKHVRIHDTREPVNTEN